MYAIENYTSQLAGSVVYKDADMSTIVHVLNCRGAKYDLYDNCYKLGYLRIYIESCNDSVWDPNEKEYNEYPAESFVTDVRKKVTQLRSFKQKK